MSQRLFILFLALSLGLFACSPTGDVHGIGGSDDDDGPGDDDDGGTEEYGPENDWFHALEADLPEGLAGTGRNTGDTAYNFTHEDQFGDEVELYQFYGKIIVLDVFAQWCGPCQANAPHGEELWEEGEGEVVLLALMEESNNGVATNAAVNEWVDAFELTHPVLADVPQSEIGYIVTGFPTYVVIDRDMTILNSDLWPFDSDWVLAQL